jgi:hypothetical protein
METENFYQKEYLKLKLEIGDYFFNKCVHFHVSFFSKLSQSKKVEILGDLYRFKENIHQNYFGCSRDMFPSELKNFPDYVKNNGESMSISDTIDIYDRMIDTVKKNFESRRIKKRLDSVYNVLRCAEISDG